MGTLLLISGCGDGGAAAKPQGPPAGLRPPTVIADQEDQPQGAKKATDENPPVADSKPPEPKSRIAISRDGKLVASGGVNSSVRLFNAENGTLARSFVGQRGAVSAIAFSHDGVQVATGNSAGEIRFWNTESADGLDEFQRSRSDDNSAFLLADGQTIRSIAFNRERSLLAATASDGAVRIVQLPLVGPEELLSHSDSLTTFALAGDETVIATAALEAGVQIWDARTSKPVQTLPSPLKEPVSSLAWSAGTALLGGGTTGGAVLLWDLKENGPPRVLAGHQGPIVDLRFLADTGGVASAGEDGRLIFWNTARAATTAASIKFKGGTRALAISADGEWLLVAPAKQGAQIIDRKTGKLIRALAGQPDNVRSLALSRDADLAAAGDATGRLVFWKASTGASLLQLAAHQGAVQKVAFSTSGKRCVSAGADGELRLWEAGTPVRVYAGSAYDAFRMAAAQDEKTIATGGDDGVVRLIDPAEGKLLRALEGHTSKVTTLAVSPDSRLLVSGDQSGVIRTWAMEGADEAFELASGAQEVTQLSFDAKGKALLAATADGDILQWPLPMSTPREIKPKSPKPTCLAASGDGKLLVVGSDDSLVQVFAAADGSLVREWTAAEPVTSVALNADGKTVAWGSASGRTDCAKVADGVTLFQGSHHQQPVRTLQFSSDSRLLVSGDEAGRIGFWKMPRAAQAVEPTPGAEPTAAIGALAISGDGTLAVSGDKLGRITLWSTQSGKKLQQFGQAGSSIASLAFGGDGANVLSLSRDHKLRTWKLAGGGVIDEQTLPEATGSGMLRPDGTAVVYVAAGESLLLWDPIGRKAIQRIAGTPATTAPLRFAGAAGLVWLDAGNFLQLRPVPATVFAAHQGAVSQAAFLGSQIVTAGADGALKLWTRGGLISREVLPAGTEPKRMVISAAGQWVAVATAAKEFSLLSLPKGEPLRTIALTADVLDAVAAPDGKKLAVACADQHIRVFDPRSGELVDNLATPVAVRSLVFTADGSGVLAAGTDKKLRLHQSVLARAWKGHAQGALDVAFGSGGNLVSGGGDKLIRIWSEKDGRQIRELKGHEAAVTSVQFSRDGQRIISGSLDQTVRFWDANTGKLEQTLSVRMPVHSLAVSKNEGRVATCSGSGAVVAFDARTGDSLQSFQGHAGGVCQSAFADEDAMLLTLGQEGSILQRPLAARRAITAHRGKIVALASSADGSLLATAGEDLTVKLWNSRGDAVREITGLEQPVGRLVVLGAGKTVAGAAVRPGKKDPLLFWNVADGKLLETVAAPAPIVSLAALPDQQSLAVASEDGAVRLFSDSGRLLGSVRCQERPRQIACGSAGNVLVLESDHALRSYLPTQKALFTGHKGASTAAEFTADGTRVVSCGEDGFIRLWSLDQNRQVAQQFAGKRPLRALCLSADDRSVIAGGDDGLVQVWDLPAAEGIEFGGPTAFYRHASGIDCISATANGQLIFTGSRDKLIHAWSTRDGKEAARLTGHEAPIIAVGGQDSATVVLSGAADNSLRVWPVPTVTGNTPAIPASVRKSTRTIAMTRDIDAALEQTRRQLDSATQEADRERLRQRLRQLQSGIDPTKDEAARATQQVPARLARLYEAMRLARSPAERQSIRDQILTAQEGGGGPGRSGEPEAAGGKRDREQDAARRLAEEARREEAAAQAAKQGLPFEMASVPTDYEFDYQHFRPVHLSISEDGNTLVAAQASVHFSEERHVEGFVQVWDVPTRLLLRSWRDVKNTNVARVLLSPDEQFIYAMPGVQTFDISRGNSQPAASAQCFAIDREHQVLAIGLAGKVLESAPTVELRSLTTLAATGDRSDYEAMVSAIAFAPGGKALAICLRERARHKVVLIDPTSLRDVRVIEEWPYRKPWHAGGVKGLTHLLFSPDGQALVGYGAYSENADNRRFTVWRENGSARVIGTQDWPEIEADARMVFVKNSNILVIETKRGVTLLDVLKGQPVGQTDLVRVHWGRPVIAFSADGGWMASGDDGGQIALWDLDKRTGPFPFKAHSGPVVGIAFSTTSGKLVTAGEENFIRVWKLPEKPVAPPKATLPRTNKKAR